MGRASLSESAGDRNLGALGILTLGWSSLSSSSISEKDRFLLFVAWAVIMPGCAGLECSWGLWRRAPRGVPLRATAPAATGGCNAALRCCSACGLNSGC